MSDDFLKFTYKLMTLLLFGACSLLPQEDLQSTKHPPDQIKTSLDKLTPNHLDPTQKKLCLKRNTRACNKLARELEEHDDERAKKFYSISCNLNNAYGCYKTGYLVGKKGRLKLARSYFAKACRLENAHACFEIATKREQEADLSAALHLYRKACQKKSTDACKRLGLYFFSNKKDEKAIVFFKKACVLEDDAGCFNLGIIYNDRHDEQQAMTYFSTACELGSLKGCLNSSSLYSIKNKLHKSYDELKRAKNLGFTDWQDIENDPSFTNLKRYRKFQLLKTPSLRQ